MAPKRRSSMVSTSAATLSPSLYSPPHTIPNKTSGLSSVMRWYAAETEAVLERIWDLHDRLNNAIHASSLTHPSSSTSSCCPRLARVDHGGGMNMGVFVNGGCRGGVDGGTSVLAAAKSKSLHAT